MNDHEIAGLLAREAGELLLELREKGLDKGVSGYQLQVIADREAHLHISKRLSELCPEDFLLSEEFFERKKIISNDFDKKFSQGILEVQTT